MVRDRIKEGRVLVTKDSQPMKIVRITQGKAEFFGSYEESPNRVYLVAFKDGHLEKIGTQEKWVNGQVCLVENSERALWARELERPNDCAVSNNGRVAVVDWLKTRQKLGGKFYVFDRSGETLVEKQFNSNLCACAISEEGNYAAVSTAFPDNSIYFFDVEKSKLKWVYKNHSRDVVLKLSISNNKVEVWTGKSKASSRYDYSLNLKGELSVEDIEKVRKIKTISQGPIEDSLRTLIQLLSSSDKEQVRRGLKELYSVAFRFKKFEKLLVPYVIPYIMDKDEEISKLSEGIILKFGRRNPDAIKPAVETILKRIKVRPDRYRDRDLYVLGILGKIRPRWVANEIPIIINDLKQSKFWQVRRWAAIVVGMIGSADPNLVKDSIPILAKYLGDAKWWLSELKELAKKDMEVAASFLTAQMLGVKPEVEVRNAAIGALGDIGEKNPEAVKDIIPMITSCLKCPEAYTRKKAIIALGQIAKKGDNYVRSAIPVLEKMAKKDPNEKVRLEAKRLLESISPEQADRSVSNIPRLIANLSSDNLVVRYESIRELERMFYGQASLPEQYYQKALLLMEQSSHRLIGCIKKIEKELSVSEDETTRFLLLESLMRAKRTFLEFIVGDRINSSLIRCKFCGRVYKVNGIRNHLARSHPKQWKKIRPYDKDVLKYLEIKNQSGLPPEEWERRLVEKYQKDRITM